MKDNEKRKKENEVIEGIPLKFQIIELVKAENKELFLDQTGSAYLSYLDYSEKLVTYPINSDQFASYLQQISYKRFKKTLTSDSVREIQQILTVETISKNDASTRHLYRRVGNQNGAIFYDLGGEAIKIDGSGWKKVTLVEQIFKFNPQVSLRQLDPISGGSIDKIFEIINVSSEQDRLLIKLFLVTSFIPDIPHPILVIHGPKGSGKSALLRMLLNIVDPTTIIDTSIRKLEDFLLSAANRWVVGLDNVSKIKLEDSDVLCKLSTGGSFQKRGLYTNESIIVMNLKNVVILNGIPCVAEKPDLLDRSLLLEVPEINPSDRRTEREINSKFKDSLPIILGACFDALSKSIEIEQNLVLNKMHRMADFHRYAVSVGLALGYTQEKVENALEKNYQSQLEVAKESSWLAQLVIDYLRERALFSGTASGFLMELRSFCAAQDLPFGFQVGRIQPNNLMKELTRSKQILNSEGVTITRVPRGEQRIIFIEMNQEIRMGRKPKGTDGIDGTVGKSKFEWQKFNSFDDIDDDVNQF